MLRITTTNGDELIHADQQPDAYTGQAYDGSQYLVHAGEWGRHKYIRKEGNRYIYPEDLQKKASAGLHKVTQVAKDVYNDRDTYVKAAKDMASDAREIAERRKYRMKDELRKQHEERQAKSDHIKDQNKKMAEGAKKLGKAMWDSSKIGHLANLGKESAEGINNLANSGKKEEVAERSMPNSVKNVGKKPLSRQKKVVDGGKEIKKGSSKTSAGPVGWNGRTADDINHIGADVAKRRDKRISQTVNAHQGVVANEKRLKNHETTAELERQKQKTAARKMAKEQQKSAHAGYEADKKTFPEGGSTEELELQKRKTASRKARKESIEAIKRANKEESQIRSAHQGDVNRPAGDHKTMMLEYQINKKKRNDAHEAKEAKQKSEYAQEVAQQNAEYKKKRKQMVDEFQQESNQMQSDYNKKVAQAKMNSARKKRAMQDRQEQYEKEYIKKHPITGRALKTGSYYLDKYVKEKRR